MASNAPAAYEDKIEILTELFRSKKIIEETDTFNLENIDAYRLKIVELKTQLELQPNFRDNLDYQFYNDFIYFYNRNKAKQIEIDNTYDYLKYYLKDIITDRQNAQIVKLSPVKTRDGVKVDMIRESLTNSISYARVFAIMNECVEVAHREEINKYKTDLEKYLEEIQSGAHEFTEMVQSFVSKATNVLIIDNENYINSKSHPDGKLKACVKTRGITHIIVVYKSRPYDYLKVIGDPKIKILEIKSAGLTLQKKQIEFTRKAQSQIKPTTYLGDPRGFGASPSVSSHLNNAHDDFMVLVIYEICKDLQKTPLIFIEDEKIKVDLLIPSNAIKGVRNYKHILPFLCHVNDRKFYIKPEDITLTGYEGKFDNYYLKFGSTDQDHYLQKYLKYKNKYLQLKKLI